VIGRLFFRWSKRHQLKLADSFLVQLKSSNPLSLGEFVCHVYNGAAQLKQHAGWDLFNRYELLYANPSVGRDIGKLVDLKRKEKDYFSSNALYLWNITLLGVMDKDFEGYAVAMWNEISRGFTSAQGFAEIYRKSGEIVDLSKLGLYPNGIEGCINDL